jgi:hypothetical protein
LNNKALKKDTFNFSGNKPFGAHLMREIRKSTSQRDVTKNARADMIRDLKVFV